MLSLRFISRRKRDFLGGFFICNRDKPDALPQQESNMKVVFMFFDHTLQRRSRLHGLYVLPPPSPFLAPHSFPSPPPPPSSPSPPLPPPLYEDLFSQDMLGHLLQRALKKQAIDRGDGQSILVFSGGCFRPFLLQA